MTTLKTKLNIRSKDYLESQSAMETLVADLNEKSAEVRIGGSEAARDKHLARGKLLPRQRIDVLLDEGTPFLELSQLAAYGMYDSAVPSAGIVTGIGRVSGV
ncbi:MAG: carboxyl transferase domain-containing protein, partial [Burkholderiales bacterium]|nr:carboxyl transferase domain-containing protein [Burkholderiales bacterium]